MKMNTRTVQMKCGVLTVMFAGNLFNADEAERQLISAITDAMRVYNSRLASTVNSKSPDSEQEEKGGN